MSLIQLFALIGVALSLYAGYIENKSASNPHYKAVCDLNDRMSCTKAFNSGYGKIFGVSNSVAGLLYYIAVYLLDRLGYAEPVFYATVAGIVASAYLAYVLYFKIKSFCIICNSTYVVNIVLLILAYLQFKA